MASSTSQVTLAQALEEFMGFSFEDMMKSAGAAEASIDDLDGIVSEEPKHQPHLVSFSDHPEVLEQDWQKTQTIGAVEIPEAIMPRAFTKKSLIHACKEIRESPYDPKVWVARAGTMMNLGYCELAIADAYKALLLTDALMNFEAVRADGGKLYIRVYSAMVKNIPQLKQVPLQEFFRSTKKMEILREVVWTYRRLAVMAMVSGLQAIRAWNDATQVLEDALKRSPNESLLARKLESNKKNMERLAQDFKTRGMDDATVAKTLKRGLVKKVPYPWIVPEELARSNTAVKRQKAKFIEASSNAIVAASSVGGTPKDNFGVFAKCDIPKGQRIILDKSIFCDYNIPGGNYCGACCESLVGKGTPVGCCQTQFCSDDCKSKALSNYHKSICSRDFAWLYDECKDVDFQNDTIPLVMLKILATAVQQGVKPLSLPCVATLTASYQNNTPSFFRLHHNVVTPIKILQTLGVDVFANTRFDSWVIQTLFLRIENNMQGRTFGKRTSIGINPLFSMFNHDCDPSAKWGPKNELVEAGGPIIVPALRDIKSNEEIKVSYVERHLPEKQRRNKLSLQLGMNCKCDRCVRARAGNKEVDRNMMDMLTAEHEPAEIENALNVMGFGAGAGKEPDMTKLMNMMGMESTSSSKKDLANLMQMMGPSLGSGSAPSGNIDPARMMDMVGSGLGSGSAPDMTKMMEMISLKSASGKKQT